MTDWVLSESLSAWVADLGPIDYIPAPPSAGIMPPPDACGGIDYFVEATTLEELITHDYAWTQVYGTDAYYFYTTVDGGTVNTGSAGVVPVDAPPWRLFVAFSGPAPDFTPPIDPPARSPESFAPPGPPIPAAEAPPTIHLFDTDGTFIQELPLAAGIQWQEELSAPGAVSFRLPLDDSATALVLPRRIVKVSWRGGFRQVARIGASSTDVAVDGRIWREWSNLPGIMSILGRVPVYPEYGLGLSGNGQRTFGYMARNGHSVWLDESADFTPAIGVKWSEMTGARAGMPEGLEFPDPYWIAKNGPMEGEPPNSYQYFRRVFSTFTAKPVQILATGDNTLDLWLDGEQLVDSRGQGQWTWRNAFQIALTLPAGRHTIAARIKNYRDTTAWPNKMGFLFTMQEVDESGEVLEVAPLINSDSDWVVSDIAPGFHRADVLWRLWLEARAYGYTACDLLPLTARALDSAGNAWDEDPAEFTVDVGSSLLDVIAAFTERAIDLTVNPDSLHVQIWNRYGSDLSGTVQLQLGRDGGNLIAHRVDRDEAGANTVLMQLQDGRWTQRQNAAGVTANGREGTGLSVGSTSDAKSANQLADAQLAETAEATVSFTSQVSALTGPQVYIDFGLGDTVTVPDEDGTGAYAARVMAITIDASSDGPVQVTPELVLDRSSAPIVTESGGPGTDDPGDLDDDTGGGGSGGAGSGGGTGGGGTPPDPIDPGGTDVAYDWTANPYGTAYDAAGGSGGYTPDDTHSGVPSGTTFAQTVTVAGGFLTISTAATSKGTGSASASTNAITLTGHGLPNGHPIYFSDLSPDGAGLATGVANWGVVSNATTNTFKVRRLNEDTGTFSIVNITADYLDVTVMAGVWYDAVDFQCHIRVASAATGLLLFTRCRHRGPAVALSPTGATPSQGLIFNLSSAYVLGVDQELIPDAPVAKLDAVYGKNFRLWRPKWKHVIDGVGSQGNNVVYGGYGIDAAWFYPDPEHTNGSHCDLGMQVFGGDKHRMLGCHVDGLVASSASSTSDSSGHPIPATTNTVLQLNHAAGLAAPTGLDFDKCLLGGGAYTVNIDGSETRLDLGHVRRSRFKRNNLYHATSAIAAPSPGAHAGVVIHLDTSGNVYDDDNATVTPYVAPGTTLVWP